MGNTLSLILATLWWWRQGATPSLLYWQQVPKARLSLVVVMADAKRCFGLRAAPRLYCHCSHFLFWTILRSNCFFQLLSWSPESLSEFLQSTTSHAYELFYSIFSGCWLFLTGCSLFFISSLPSRCNTWELYLYLFTITQWKLSKIFLSWLSLFFLLQILWWFSK